VEKQSCVLCVFAQLLRVLRGQKKCQTYGGIYGKGGPALEVAVVHAPAHCNMAHLLYRLSALIKQGGLRDGRPYLVLVLVDRPAK